MHFSKKKSSYTLMEVFFSTYVTYFSKYDEIAFILYLSTIFYLGIKNPIYNFFYEKFTCIVFMNKK